MKIVCMGGGTGLPVLLRGLRRLAEAPGLARQSIESTAVVCVTDNGGSSGVLRDAFGIPAVGDLRNCLVALAGVDNPLGQLFQHRLGSGEGLLGHAVGNLIVTALCERTGNFCEAIRQAADLLQSKGRIIPVSETPVTLCAQFSDGSVTRGEVEIVRQRRRIRRVWLEPGTASPTPGLLSAILSADVIVLGPGSLYTSIIPNLLTRGVAAAIRCSSALKVLVCNLMTQSGETDELTASEHLAAVAEYLGHGIVQAVVLNGSPIEESLLERYRSAGVRPVENDIDRIFRLGAAPFVADLLQEGALQVRHDSLKLARLIASLGHDSLKAAGGGRWTVTADSQSASKSLRPAPC